MRRALLFVALTATPALAAPVAVTGEPVAAAPGDPGTGLCSATAVSSSPATDFGTLTTVTFVAGVNAFVDAHAADRIGGVTATPLDLTNGNLAGLALSQGDFRDAVSGCSPGGCLFAVADTTTSFAVRWRGYWEIAPAQVGQPLHLGFYTDDAVALTIFDAAGTAYPVAVRPTQLGAPTWRLTNTVTFAASGLYPVELLYVEISDHAALEVSLLEGAFTDFERPANQVPVEELDAAGFLLLGPAVLHQTVAGGPTQTDPTACTQCDRTLVNQATGCGTARYCNEAAVCAPCDVDAFCGPTCAPCDGGERCDALAGACVPLPIDAGPVDASVVDAPRDAAAVDAGRPGEDSGCGCHAAGRGRAGFSLVLLLLLVLRRRRYSGARLR